MKIFAGRASILGDTIMALPLLNVLHKMYDNPEIHWPIAPKCKQAAPLYLFQDKIDSIVQTQNNDGLLKKEHELLQSQYDLVINPFPNHSKEQDWYNYRSCVEETMLMTGEKYYEVWQNLPKDLQQPRLDPWWLQDKPKCHKEKKEIAIFPFCGYGKGMERSPSEKWWKKLLNILIDDFDYKIIHFGHFNEPDLWPFGPWEHFNSEHEYYQNKTHLPFFTQIQLAYECDLTIGTDSGSGWICGALGMNQISLITNHNSNHYTNYLALAPINHASNAKNLFSENSCDNISVDSVLGLLNDF